MGLTPPPPNFDGFVLILVDEGERGTSQIPLHLYKRVTISQPVKRPALNGSFVIFQGIMISIDKKPYIFVISGGGGGPSPLSPSGSAHVIGPLYEKTIGVCYHDMFNPAFSARKGKLSNFCMYGV